MIACDKTVRTKRLGNFFTNSRRCSAEVGKKLSTIIMKKLWKALKIGAKNGTGLASKKPNPIWSTIAELKKFSHNW